MKKVLKKEIIYKIIFKDEKIAEKYTDLLATIKNDLDSHFINNQDIESTDIYGSVWFNKEQYATNKRNN